MSDPHGIIGIQRKGGCMRTVEKLRAITVGQLVDEIYDDNYSHLDFMDNMGGDCDCNIHSALNLILEYWEVK